MDKNDVGAGYIALKIGDTVQDGDQRYLDFCWVPVPKKKIGTVLKRMHWPMHRKSEVQVPETPKGTVDPGPGYRLLKDGELLKKGDAFLNEPGDWRPTYAGAGEHVVGSPGYRIPYRRKVSEPSKVPTPIPSTDNSAACVPISKGLFAPVLEGPKGSSIFHRDFQAVEAKVYGTLASLGLLHLLPKPFTPNKYTRDLVALDGRKVPVDVYCVLAAFPTDNSAIDHAVKKQLAPGQRGQKSRLQDLKEARASLDRAIQMEGG